MNEEKTSSSFQAVFDALITEAVDSSKFIFQALEDGEHYIEERELIFQESAHAPRGGDTKSYSPI